MPAAVSGQLQKARFFHRPSLRTSFANPEKGCFFSLEKAPFDRFGSRRERGARSPAAKAEGPVRAGYCFSEDRPCVKNKSKTKTNRRHPLFAVFPPLFGAGGVKARTGLWDWHWEPGAVASFWRWSIPCPRERRSRPRRRNSSSSLARIRGSKRDRLDSRAWPGPWPSCHRPGNRSGDYALLA